jgi:hypothetical protein
VTSFVESRVVGILGMLLAVVWVVRLVLRMKSMTIVKMHVIYHRQPGKYCRGHLWYMGEPRLLLAQRGGNCPEASTLLSSHASIGSRRLRLSVHLL